MERRAAAFLSLLCVLLAAMCVAIGLAYRAANQEALCWRAFVEDGEHPPEGECRRQSVFRP